MLDGVCFKPYAAMMGTQAAVDCARVLQGKYVKDSSRENLRNINSVDTTLDEVCFHHVGFEIQRPLLATGAQMSAA